VSFIGFNCSPFSFRIDGNQAEKNIRDGVRILAFEFLNKYFKNINHRLYYLVINIIKRKSLEEEYLALRREDKKNFHF
jgi:hypothetical protein